MFCIFNSVEVCRLGRRQTVIRTIELADVQLVDLLLRLSAVLVDAVAESTLKIIGYFDDLDRISWIHRWSPDTGIP